MKHFLYLIFAVAFCQTSFGADAATSAKTKQNGARVQEKAVNVRHRRGMLGGGPAGASGMTVLFRVETRLEGGKQKITATATAHKGGQEGALIPVGSLEVVVREPAQFKKETSQTHTAIASGSVESADGKYKTVVANAFLTCEGFENTKVAVSVPGGG